MKPRWQVPINLKANPVSDVPQECPKCGGAMEQGFIPDMTYGARLVNQWAAGPPEKSFWTATRRPEEKTIPIGVFRCASCGYLEQYARTDFGAR